MQLSVEIIIFLLACISYALSIPVPEPAESARIVNGQAVDITEVPYQAAIKKRVLSGWAHMCGAIVISDRGILTAAHCADSYVTQPSSIRVIVGTSSRITGGKMYDVSVVFLHEGYSAETLEHDIALLGTTKAIEFSQYVAPIALASQHFVLPAGTGAIVSGFGTTSYEGSSSEVLRAAQVSVVSQASCARAYMRIAAITSGMVCAGSSNPARDACQGDSGGPLVVGSHLIGVVSWGEGCANSKYPGVYTRVSSYNSWITQRLQLLQLRG